jgi:competence protein ComEC
MADFTASLYAVMNNGAAKGGSIKALTTIRNSPGLQDLWQLHFSNEGGKEYNTAEKFIANLSSENDAGYAIEVTARADGTFNVRNDRNQFEKTYR